MYRYLGNYWNVKCRNLAQVIKYLIYLQIENATEETKELKYPDIFIKKLSKHLVEDNVEQLRYRSEFNPKYNLDVLITSHANWHSDSINYTLGLVLQSNNYIFEYNDGCKIKTQLLKSGDVFFFEATNRHRLIKNKQEDYKENKESLEYFDFFIMAFWDFDTLGFGEDKMPSKKDLRKLIKQALNNFE